MKVIEHLKKANGTQFSFELLPPLKGHNIKEIYKTIDPLMEFNPLNINVTYHQEETVFKRHENGLLEKKTVRKRPGTVAISAAIKYKYPNVHVVPHIICGGFTKEETEYALIDFHFLGMHNLLVLRGDPQKTERSFIPEKGGHVYATDLIKQIINLNKSIYLDEELQNTTSTDFSVGVAGYPEKHVEAPNMESDLHYLKQKIDAGADYIITQMFFDNKNFFDFVDLCRKIGIKVPIIAGIKPIATKNDINILPKIFNIDIPNDLVNEIQKCETNKDAFQAGIEWSIHQSSELIKHGAAAIHYYTIGISENIKQIVQAVF